MTKLVVVDYETYYDSEYSLRKMTTQEYIRDPRFKVHGVGVKVNDKPTIWVPAKHVRPVLEKVIPGNIVVHHNANFDGSISQWHYGLSPKLYIDTLALSRAVLGDVIKRHGLDNVAEFLLNARKGTGLANTLGIRDLDPGTEAILADYCKNDCDLTYGIFKKLMVGFPKSMLKVVDWTIRAFTEPKLLLDVELMEEHLAAVRERKAVILAEAGLDSKETLMSNPKFAEALREFGVVPPMKTNAKGEPAFAFAKTDEGLKALLEHEDERVQCLVAARLEHKTTIEETRTVSYLKAATFGPWPVDYKYAGATNTLRFSGANGAGGNPQNLGRNSPLRRAIYAPEGKVIGVSDLSQIELRVTLAFAGEWEALDILRKGGDLYKWFAAKMYNVDIEDVTKEQRRVAKSAVLGLGFGMGAARFLDYCGEQGVPMYMAMAELAKDLYRDTFPGVPKLWYMAEADLAYACNNHAVSFGRLKPAVVTSGHAPVLELCPGFKLPSGHWIKYPGLRKDEEGQWIHMTGFGPRRLWGGVVVENVVQAVAADVIKEQLLLVDAKYPVAMSTHDELAALLDELAADEQLADIAGIMSKSPTWWPDLPLGVEAHHAIRYGDAK